MRSCACGHPAIVCEPCARTVSWRDRLGPDIPADPDTDTCIVCHTRDTAWCAPCWATRGKHDHRPSPSTH